MSKSLPRYPLNQSPFYRLRRARRLAEILELDRASLDKLIGETDSLYREKEVISDRGKLRKTEMPRGNLRKTHDRIATLLARIQPPDFLFCPVKGRSYVSNAAMHKAGRVIRSLDIKDYFPSTPSRRVFWFFKNIMQCSPDVSAILAKIVCRNGRLPTGSPASPILAFYAFWDLWTGLAKIAKDAQCTMTVYMDDVTVSGQRVPDSLIWRMKRQIHGSGLRYHKERKYLNQSSVVTGVVIRDGLLSLRNGQHRRFYDVKKQLATTHDTDRVLSLKRTLRGILSQRKQVQTANRRA